MKTLLNKTFEFGKIALAPYTKTKKCLVTIEVKIRDSDVFTFENCEKKIVRTDRVISFIGNIWNGGKTDCYTCGQNSETISEHYLDLTNRVVLKVILTLWKKYHLCKIEAISEEDKELMKEVLDIDIDKYIVA